MCLGEYYIFLSTFKTIKSNPRRISNDVDFSRMRICDSEENRRKLAWLVPGYILLAWFFCVVFQPLGLNSAPGQGNNNDLNDESLYEIINLQDDPQVSGQEPH